MLPLKVPPHHDKQDDHSDAIDLNGDHQNAIDNDYDAALQGGLTHWLPSACAGSSKSWSWKVKFLNWFNFGTNLI